MLKQPFRTSKGASHTAYMLANMYFKSCQRLPSWVVIKYFCPEFGVERRFSLNLAEMKLTALVDTDGLPSVPCSFALAFAFLAASRFFLESDTICAVWAQLLWIVRKTSVIEIAPSPTCFQHANERRHGLTVSFRQQEARCIMPNINPANGSSSPSFSIRSKL